MNRRQAITKACLLLRRQGKEESLARFLLMYMLDESPQLFSNSFSEQMSKENENKYFSLIEKHIKEDVPLSHLVGFEYFYDRKYKVTKDVLSPRMETEELIYKVIEYVKASSKNNFKILDLCTGSGIIAITLKKELSQFSIDVVASDISEEAIKVAKENAQSHDATIKFIQSDIFNNIADKFDIIVSNPPYIDRKDEVTMQDNVLKYDPHLALFAEEEGMYFYRKIIEQANDYLNENGVIFFEIGYDQKDKIIKLADLNGYSAEVYKDINGRDRMAFLVRK
ncbi:MAG: peptide chain release factor N(5)-glutamine methyltransferase [Gemella haemolysans]|jgi:protein-(glutamine-N5) methyltransferase, release factor-specific|uniref:peptide chain release factor N(5)-glutamine methyltransferase n=1 Tax=Gemella haemolysans TaxID=1379 RepID=UPI0026EE5BA1|nr:peptide chain release factor N(5)-glutamine methyltransferase [Gemella haemolysans]MBS5318123.1 peptide chain release factor N(5)-glutamine methyltransferase [Gemella haemolysans]MDU6767369.1 peptide chain release factor N(5)-glutamine methyltransferase [Gemella haemolysans]